MLRVRRRAAVRQPRSRIRAASGAAHRGARSRPAEGWSGSYDDYVLEKRAALDVEAKHAALFDKKLAQEEAWIRQGIEARRTRNEGRVRALEAVAHRAYASGASVGADGAQGAGCGTVGQAGVRGARASRSTSADRPVIADFSARIMRGDRIGIVGPNGCGKTTLIKLLMGELEPMRRIDLPRHLAPARLLRSAARHARSGGLAHGQCHGRQRRDRDHRRPVRGTCRGTCAIFCFRRSDCARR